MACTMTVYDATSNAKNKYVCDEDTTTRVVEDEFAGSATGEYTGTDGKNFSVNWQNCRLVAFSRE